MSYYIMLHYITCCSLADARVRRPPTTRRSRSTDRSLPQPHIYIYIYTHRYIHINVTITICIYMFIYTYITITYYSEDIMLIVLSYIISCWIPYIISY